MKRILSLSLIFLSLILYAQIKDVTTTFFYGQPFGKIKGTESNFVYGGIINLQKTLDSEWSQQINAKKYNVGLIAVDMNGAKIPAFRFGSIYGVLAEIEIGLLQKGKFDLNIVPGAGLSYNSKTAFTTKDYYIFATHINALFTSALKINYQINPKTDLFASYIFLHSSNGSYKIPNSGINILAYGLGLKLRLIEDEQVPKTNTTLFDPNKILESKFEFLTNIGRRGKYKLNDGFYRVSMSGMYTFYNVGFILFKGGTDITFYEETYNPKVYEDSVKYLGETNKPYKIGISVGSEFLMNRVSVNLNYGHYIFFNSVYNQKTFWNFGFRYYIASNFGIQTKMNAHKTQADYADIGFFYKF